jgi:hypothetical protein
MKIGVKFEHCWRRTKSGITQRTLVSKAFTSAPSTPICAKTSIFPGCAATSPLSSVLA